MIIMSCRTISLILIIHLILIRAKVDISPNCMATNPAEILCNNGTRLVCICYSPAINRSSISDHCYSLVITDTLPALRLTLSPPPDLHTLDSLSRKTLGKLINNLNMTYEYYYKFRISNIISGYCSENEHHCTSITKTIRPENVVILRLSCEEDNNHLIDYTILKSADSHNLSDQSVIEPGLVLEALKPKLQKVINHKILDHKPHLLVIAEPESSPGGDNNGNGWTRIFKENLGFIIALIVIIALLTIVYIVAIIKAFRDRSRRHPRTVKSTKSTKLVPPESKAAQYGAMGERLLSEVSMRIETTPSKERDLFFTTMADDETTDNITADPVPANGAFGYYVQPSAEQPEEHDYDSSRKASSEIHPPPTSMTLVTTKSSKTVTTSQSMQLHRNEKGAVKKAVTFHQLTDELALGPTATPPSLISAQIASPINGEDKTDSQEGTEGSSYRSRASTIIQIPVLIVPAMSSHLNDDDFDPEKDYDDLLTPVDQKFIGTDQQEIHTDYDNIRKKKGRKKAKHLALERATSDEYLLPKDATGSVLLSDQPTSSISSDTVNSETEAQLDSGGFHLLMSGIGYQPLRESNWSVNNVKDEEKSPD